MVLRCRSLKMSIRSVTSVRAVSTNRSAIAFARGLRGGIFTAWIPVLARTASNDVVNLPGAVADQESEVGGVLSEVHHEVADLLGGPRAVGAAGLAAPVVDDTEDGHVPAPGDPQYQWVNQPGDGSDQPLGAGSEDKGVPGRAGRSLLICCGRPAVWSWLKDGRFRVW
jgi:hypothetical protein